jgi:hypothetical protein
VNPRRAAKRVRLRYRANQGANVRRHGRPPHAPALPGPRQPKASSVPGDENRSRPEFLRSTGGPGNARFVA